MACQIVAVKDAIVKPKTKLFRYPFSNAYASNQACWPELTNIKIKNLYEQAQNLPGSFFELRRQITICLKV